jgi:small subunit ribosomal protein S6
MTMRRYEALLLTVPEITGDEAKSVENEISRLAKGAKGTIISFERWGKYKLAYPVKKNDYGIYFLVRFEIPTGSTVIDEIKSLFAVKLHEVVMRSCFSRLDQDKLLEYQRPKSLEEAPTSHDVDAFLKENKMEGLLSSVESTAKEPIEELEELEEGEQEMEPAERTPDEPAQE